MGSAGGLFVFRDQNLNFKEAQELSLYGFLAVFFSYLFSKLVILELRYSGTDPSRFRLDIPDLIYHPFDGLVSHGAPIGYSDFYRPHTWKQTQSKCIHELHASCGFSCACLSARSDHIRCRPTYAPDESRLFWSWGKPGILTMEAHARKKMASWISSLNLCQTLMMCIWPGGGYSTLSWVWMWSPKCWPPPYN